MTKAGCKSWGWSFEKARISLPDFKPKMRNHGNQPITFKKFNYMQLTNDLAFPKRNLPRGPFFWSSILNFKGMYSIIKPSNISNKLECPMSRKPQMFHPNVWGALVMRLPVRHLFQSFATDWEKLTKIRLEVESLERCWTTQLPKTNSHFALEN